MDALLGSRTATLFWVVFLPPVGFLHGVLPCGGSWRRAGGLRTG